MKSLRFGFLALFMSIAPFASAQASNYRPLNDRLPEKPAWERDVTDSLKLDSGGGYATVMSRQARVNRVRGGDLKWTLAVEVPAARLAWPVVIDTDESRVFSGVSVDGKSASFDRRDEGDLWFSGEGSLLLPLTPKNPSCHIVMSQRDVPQAYENGFGRLRLRPATLNELLRFNRNDNSGEVRVVNRASVPLTFEVHIRSEDFFGVSLVDQTQTLALDANSDVRLALPQVDTTKGELYKTRIWGTLGERQTYEYQTIVDGTRLTRSRSVVARLTNNWEKVFVTGPPAENPAPTTGWMDASVKLDASNSPTHYMWARQKFTVPASFPADERVQLVIPPSINYRGRILYDGQLLGEVYGWELPRRFTLPESAKPGTEHELLVGVTDYIVGLAPGVKTPDGGPFSAGGRSMAAPIGTTGPLSIGIGSTPELIPLPATHSDDVVIRTYVTPTNHIEANAHVSNDKDVASDLGVRMRVFDAGTEVFDLGQSAIHLAPGQTSLVSFDKPWANPLYWSPENPHLYELRTEILGTNGQIVDTRRDRFGFREWGIRGGYFTLNGEVIKLHGGSHIFPTSLMWPARPSSYRIMRHQAFAIGGVTGGGQTQGVIGANTADELGYVIKANNVNLNAHGADNYAWQQDEIWDRLYDASVANSLVYINNPSVVMWDIANEISFRGPGEADKMGQLFARIRAFDPTRYVTNGGSNPLVTGSDVIDYHGWGHWNNRTDYWFYHPEERPSYLRDGGYFQHKPAGEPADKWIADLKNGEGDLQLYPGYARDLRHIDNHPAVFSEGVYMGSVDTFPMFGHDTFLSLPINPNSEQGANEGAWRDLNVVANRRLALQNVRQAGFSASMIHVSGGTGRSLLPLASFSWDRKFRFNSASRLQTRFGVHNDLTETKSIVARYRLFDGEKVIGEKTAKMTMKPGTISFVELDFPLPTVTSDRTLRLEVRVWPTNGGGWFYDDLPITVYAPRPMTLPAGVTLAVYDPKNAETPTLTAAKVPFRTLAKLDDWNGQSALLIGSEGLNSATAQERLNLTPKIEAGGKVVVLDHFSLPSFLPKSLVQSREADSYVAREMEPSPVMNGLLTEDLRAWTTREHDQVTSWNPLETPASGEFRVYSTTVEHAPVLEVGQGKGRVLFVQLNLKDALGLEPAASRVLANVLDWTASPSPFQNVPSVVVAGDDKIASGLKNRVGLDATVSDVPDANLIIASGTSEASLANLQTNQATVKTRLENGGTLFFYGLDEAGATWLSGFTGSPVHIASFPHRYAYLTQLDSPLMAGLGHGDFWIDGLDKSLNPYQPLNAAKGTTGNFVLSGPAVRTLTNPAYVSEIPVGKGRIVVDLVRSLENPVPSQMRILSVLLANAGAHVDPDGGTAADTTSWKFTTLDLTPFVNRSLTDTDDPTKPRGYNGSGADDDLRDFPTGKQTLNGVDYYITLAEKANGNSVILLAGKDAKIGGVTEVKGIPVHAKAERLYFLHNSAWGVPGFTYRIYYTADRKVWIPGMPDPFVDVVVKPDENITEWVLAGKALAGASTAWRGGNNRTRANYQGGDKALGVYQMIWDNPHPEKEIESIDILSPGLVGNGNAFVFAITAANRDDSGGPKPALAAVLPKDVNASDVLEQVQFPNYGFVLLKSGVVASIYDANGQPFARSTPWKAETSGGAPGQPRQTIKLGDQTDGSSQLEKSGNGGRRVWDFSGKGPVDWRSTVIATPGRLRYELHYTPKEPLKPNFGAGLSTGLSFINGTQAAVNVNEDPFRLKTQSGEAILNFDSRYQRWAYSYQLSKDSVNFSSPPKDGAPWTTGLEDSLWWEITPP